MTRRRKVLLVAAAIGLPVLVAGAGAAYAGYYHDRGLPGTTVAGQSVTGLTRAEVRTLLTERAAHVSVTYRVGDRTTTADLADLGYRVDVDATVAKAFAQNATWGDELGALLQRHAVPAVVHAAPKTLDALSARITAAAGLAGSDAAVALAADGATFTVTPAVPGKSIDPTTFADVARTAATSLTSATTTLGFVDAAPEVTTQAAQQVADQANALVALPVTVTDGTQQYTASAADKASWVTVPTTTHGLGTPTLDTAKAADWVEQVAAGTNTDPTTGVRYVDPQGNVLSVVKKAVDGRAVSNGDAIAAELTRSLEQGQGYTGTFEYQTVTAEWTSKQVNSLSDVLAYSPADGERWIDVNLSAHTMTAYEGTTVVYGPVAVVNGAAATPTVVGTYHIYSKVRTQTMRGLNADGTTYEQPDVPYINYFYSGYALHGAPYRKSFGYAASHGCVNLSVSAAKWLYGWTSVGTAVVTHR